MPRKTNPADIKTGPGKTVPGQDEQDIPVLVGSGVSDGIGGVGHIPPGGGLPDARPGLTPPWGPGAGGGGGEPGLKAHLESLRAHNAVAIVVNGHPDLLQSLSVEGALDELMGNLPPRPPMVGEEFNYISGYSGITDWGALKLNDSSIQLRQPLISRLDNQPSRVYPYYLTAPNPTSDWGTEGLPTNENIYGADPQTDRFWNVPDYPAGSPIGHMYGGGIGFMVAGGFTEEDPSNPGSFLVQRSNKLLPSTVTFWPVITFSGTVHPADRGVLALLHLPIFTPTIQDFLDQPLLERCLAALLLGQGMTGSACQSPEDPGGFGNPCDGGAGGIFFPGEDDDGNFDPFAFPGMASGQFNLDELHTGVYSFIPAALPPPYDDLDNDGSPGAQHKYDVPIPAPGQVRLGTDPSADPANPPLSWGIPILGATVNAYDTTSGPWPPATVIGAPYAGEPRVGLSVLMNSNFFGYRLPMLTDYSQDTGLKYTPRGAYPTTTIEVARYFQSTAVYGIPDENEPFQWDLPTPTSYSLDQAGNYPAFEEDAWLWQIARFRHSIVLSGNEDASAPPSDTKMTLGTYLLIHFKSEDDFERFVRDGEMPDSVYSASVDPAVCPAGPNAECALVNQLLALDSHKPYGPAFEYGYSATSYHTTESKVQMGRTINDQAVARTDFTLAAYDWEIPPFADGPGMVWNSGVAYFTPHNWEDDQAFRFYELGVTVDDAWNGSYRTDDKLLDGDPPVPPARMSSPNPAFLGLAPFSYEPGSYEPPGAWSDTYYHRTQRIEFPFSMLGEDGSANPYDDDHGPQDADVLDLQMPNEQHIIFHGDEFTPSFSTNAIPRFFIRRPLGHLEAEHVADPEPDDSNLLDLIGHGKILQPISEGRVLFHSTKFNPDNTTGRYGNFIVTPPGATPVPTFPELFEMDKFTPRDTYEPFLDEVYRYRSNWDGVAEDSYLIGPGMNGYASGPIPVPVKAGLVGDATYVTTRTDFADASWVQNYDMFYWLTGADPGYGHLQYELQVCGLPDRNPTVYSWARYPFPSAGLLRYPNVDYVAPPTVYRPNAADIATLIQPPPAFVHAAQPDYSVCVDTRTYVRAFDAAFVGFGGSKVVAAAGQPFVVFRVDGLHWEDFAYTAPGPGNAQGTDGKIAIMVKVPGLTTWMDLGRRDGDGPSKQDQSLDGAGCAVIGPETFNGIDDNTGVVFTQVKVNVGPYVNLAQGQDQGSGAYEVPVLVKVIMEPMVEGVYDFTTNDSGGAAGSRAGSGLNAYEAKGLIGLRLVHPDDVETYYDWTELVPLLGP